MKFKPVPLPLRRLMLRLNGKILEFPGVRHAWMWGSRHYKIGDKLFVCFFMTSKWLSLEFKVPPGTAKQALKFSFAKPSSWKSMAANGWIEVRLTRAGQLRPVLSWIKASRSLFPA